MMSIMTAGAAWLLGLAGSGHCLVMCGGITTALSVATAKGVDGGSSVRLLIAYQCGRIASYSIAGLILGGALGGVVRLLNVEELRVGLRGLTAIALFAAALGILGRRLPSLGLGSRLWTVLSPLGRQLLPVRKLPQAFAFGMIWGWMPCGLVYTVLTIATLQSDALRAAGTMAAFGFGTAPAMLALSAGGRKFSGVSGSVTAQRWVGGLLCACAALTLMGPWLVGRATWLHEWLPLVCGPQ